METKIENGSQIELLCETSVRDKHGNLKSSYSSARQAAFLYKRIIVRDEQGRVREDTGLTPAHSYTKQFLQFFEARFQNTTVTVKDISGTNRLIRFDLGYLSPGREGVFNAAGANADILHGIVVGTGQTAESDEDYALGGRIVHGTGAGQLSYGQQGYVTPAVNGGYVDFVITRAFYNGSGDPVTCYEFGVYVQSSYNPYLYFCIIRDVEAGGKTVLDGDTMVVQYTLRVGAGFTLNFWRLLAGYLMNTQSFTATTTAGASVTVVRTPADSGDAGWDDTDHVYCNAGSEVTAFGLVIGSGVGAEAFTDYTLGSQIAEVSYQPMNFVSVALVGDNVDFVFSRSFYNNSGVQKAVSEIGLIVRQNTSYSATSYIMLLRDKLPSTVLIDPEDTGTIQYTFRTNVNV